MEIERKWWLKELPSRCLEPAIEKKVFWQGYLDLATGLDARVRVSDDKSLLTFKSVEGLVREEYEQEIPAWLFARLWPATRDVRLLKTRHFVPEDGKTLEFDVYSGNLHGLVIAECEFPTVSEAQAFELPAWVTGATDVTYSPKFKNRNLAKYRSLEELVAAPDGLEGLDK